MKFPQLQVGDLCFDAGYRAAGIRILNKTSKSWPHRKIRRILETATYRGMSHFFAGLRQPFAGAPFSSVVVIAKGAVVVAATHTAFLEICDPNHIGTDHCGPTSQRVPYPREPHGKPRFTFISDGKPLRRRPLVASKRNSFFMALFLPDGFELRSCAMSCSSDLISLTPCILRTYETVVELGKS